MPIEFHAQSRTFHLHNRQMSYIFKVLPSGHLGQLYCGRAIHDRPDFDHLFETAYRSMSVCYFDGEPAYSLEHIKQEYVEQAQHRVTECEKENAPHEIDKQLQHPQRY